jgi:hypothetical protein
MIIIWGFKTADPHNIAGDRRKKTTGHTPQLHSVAVRLPLRAGP